MSETIERFAIFSPKSRLFKKLDFDTYENAVKFLVGIRWAWIAGGNEDVDIKFRRGVEINSITSSTSQGGQ